MRHVNHIGKPTIIDEPGIYRTRCGELVTVNKVVEHVACGEYPNGIPDTWDVNGRLYPSSESDNDIVSKPISRETILNADGISFWAKDALKHLEQRDIVDAIADLEMLSEYFNVKLKNMMTPA